MQLLAPGGREAPGRLGRAISKPSRSAAVTTALIWFTSRAPQVTLQATRFSLVRLACVKPCLSPQVHYIAMIVMQGFYILRPLIMGVARTEKFLLTIVLIILTWSKNTSSPVCAIFQRKEYFTLTLSIFSTPDVSLISPLYILEYWFTPCFTWRRPRNIIKHWIVWWWCPFERIEISPEAKSFVILEVHFSLDGLQMNPPRTLDLPIFKKKN